MTKRATKIASMTAFNHALRTVLSVDKDELKRREEEYKAENAHKAKRGPKPKHGASAHASDTGDI